MLPTEAGSTQEVAWAVLANHGGGYQYRICPKSKVSATTFRSYSRLSASLTRIRGRQEPTEECFQSMPLPFVGKTTTIRMDDNETQPDFEIPAMDTTIGTSPAGSAWRRNPIRKCNHPFAASSSPLKEAAALAAACNCDLGEEGSCWGGDSKGYGIGGNFTKAYEIDPQAPKKTPRCPTGVQFPPAWPEGCALPHARTFSSCLAFRGLLTRTSIGDFLPWFPWP